MRPAPVTRTLYPRGNPGHGTNKNPPLVFIFFFFFSSLGRRRELTPCTPVLLSLDDSSQFPTMHRIASLGDMQESNKHERHHIAHGGARKQSTLWDSDDEQHAAMVDLGRVFEFVLKNTVVALVAAVWQSVAGLYYLAREGDYDALWEPATEMFHGTD